MSEENKKKNKNCSLAGIAMSSPLASSETGESRSPSRNEPVANAPGSSSAGPKEGQLRSTRRAPQRYPKIAPRPKNRQHGNRQRKVNPGAGVLPENLKGLLPRNLFEQDDRAARLKRAVAEAHQLGRAAVLERVQSLMPASEAAKKSNADDVSEHTTTMEMRRFAAEGELTRVSVIEEPTGFMHILRQLTNLSCDTATAPMSPGREQKAPRDQVEMYSTPDVAAANHRSLAVLSAGQEEGQSPPVRRSARLRTAARPPNSRVNRLFETCMLVLSAVVMMLLLPTLTLLLPYLRSADEAVAHEADAAALETLAPVLVYKLPREQHSDCFPRRNQTLSTRSMPTENATISAQGSQHTLSLPVIRRRRLVCLYKATHDTIRLINALFRLCTDVVYGQFYVDKKGPSSKQPTLDAKLPDKSPFAHRPVTLGWIGGELSDAGDFSRLASKSKHSLQLFRHGFLAWLDSWNFDGAHIDWRYPGGPCQVADDVDRFVTLLKTLRDTARLLSVAIPYKESLLAKRFKVNAISSLADLLVISTDETLAEDFAGQPLCAGRPVLQVAASLWRVGRMVAAQQQPTPNDRAKLCYAVSLASIVYHRRFARPQVSDNGMFEVGAMVPFSDHCLNKTGFTKQPLLSEAGCTALVRESYDAPRVIAAAGPDDLRRRLEEAYVVHDVGHECIAASNLASDDYAGRCGLGRWPLLRALY